MVRKKNKNPQRLPQNTIINNQRLDFSDIESIGSDVIDVVQSDDESPLPNLNDYIDLTDIKENDRNSLEEIIKDGERDKWDDKLFSKETLDYMTEELKITQARIAAKQKRIENALKKIRTGTTSGPSCSSGINEPRSKRMRRTTQRFEPEPDSIAVKRAMRETMPRKEYITSSSSSSSSNYLPPPKKFMIDEKAKSKNLPPPVSTAETLIKKKKRKPGTGSVYFNKSRQKWSAVGPHEKYIGRYNTREKAEKAVKHYNETGERMESDTSPRWTGNKGKSYKVVDGKYYCLLCDDGGWSGPSSVWYHMKRKHGAETRTYCRRVPLKKKKYERQHSSSKKYYTAKQKKERRPFRDKLLANRDRKRQEKKDDANLLLGFAEGAIQEENTKKAIAKNAVINQLQSLFRKFKNPDGANIFIELINNNSSYGEIIIKETKNYIEKISIRDKDKIKQYTMDFLQTLALIKRQHSKEQLTIFEGFEFEELDVHDTGEKDDDGNPIKIVASENKFGGRKSRKKRRKSRKKRRKIRKKTRKKRKGRKSRRRR